MGEAKHRTAYALDLIRLHLGSGMLEDPERPRVTGTLTAREKRAMLLPIGSRFASAAHTT